MAKNATSEAFVTPTFRLGFPNLFEPRPGLDGGEPKYGITMLFPKDADLAPLKQAVKKVVVEQFGPDKTKWPAVLRLPFRDQGEKADQYDGFVPGAVFVNATKTAKFGAPGVVDAKNVLVTNPAQAFPGANARAQIVAFYYDRRGNKGVSFGLNHVQLLGGGDPIGGFTRPEDAFEPVAGADSADDIDFGDDGGDVGDILG